MTKFLILGNNNAITYKEIFKYIKSNELWLGINYVKEFIQPDKSIKKFGNICWFTNIPHNKNEKPIELTKTYNPTDYPKYDNYDAIEVSKVKDIPIDYDGVMGVPISFLDKYCNSQFEIVGWSRHNDLEMDGGYWQGGKADATINGKEVYRRILIKKNAQFEILGIANSARWIGNFPCYTIINGKKVYNRILIRKIK